MGQEQGGSLAEEGRRGLYPQPTPHTLRSQETRSWGQGQAGGSCEQGEDGQRLDLNKGGKGGSVTQREGERGLLGRWWGDYKPSE